MRAIRSVCWRVRHGPVALCGPRIQQAAVRRWPKALVDPMLRQSAAGSSAAWSPCCIRVLQAAVPHGPPAASEFSRQQCGMIPVLHQSAAGSSAAWSPCCIRVLQAAVQHGRRAASECSRQQCGSVAPLTFCLLRCPCISMRGHCLPGELPRTWHTKTSSYKQPLSPGSVWENIFHTNKYEQYNNVPHSLKMPYLLDRVARKTDRTLIIKKLVLYKMFAKKFQIM